MEGYEKRSNFCRSLANNQCNNFLPSLEYSMIHPHSVFITEALADTSQLIQAKVNDEWIDCPLSYVVDSDEGVYEFRFSPYVSSIGDNMLMQHWESTDGLPLSQRLRNIAEQSILLEHYRISNISQYKYLQIGDLPSAHDFNLAMKVVDQLTDHILKRV